MRNVILTRIGRRFEITGHPPVGRVGDPYWYTFGTTGGSGAIAWTCTSLGSSGATFSAGTLSSASLTNGGAFPFTLTATDENRQVATANFVLIVLGSSSEFLLDESGNILLSESGVGLEPE
jgi:hypothetical protein